MTTELSKDDDFFIDENGWVIVEDPQHGHAIQLRKATAADKQAYLDRYLSPELQKQYGHLLVK